MCPLSSDCVMITVILISDPHSNMYVVCSTCTKNFTITALDFNAHLETTHFIPSG